MDTVKIPAICFKSGDYSNIGMHNYTERDLVDIVNRTNSYGLQAVNFKDNAIPLTIEHIDSENTIDLGGAIAGSFKKVGEYVETILEIPKVALKLLKSRFLSVEISPKNKIIKKITITTDPVIKDAKFSNNISTSDEDTDFFSFSFSQKGESNMDELIEETIVEEVENKEESVEVPEQVEEVVEDDNFSLSEDIAEAVCDTVEAVLEEKVMEMEGEPMEEMGCSTDEEDKEEDKMSDQDKRIAELEARLAELEDEKWSASVEKYSANLVSKGVPPVIAKLSAPWIAKEGIEKFSNEADAVKTIKEIVEFFSDPKMFSAKLRDEDREVLIQTDDFSENAIINKVRAQCAKEGIEIHSNEYRTRLAKEMCKA